MMQGPIQRTARHRIDPRGDARLPTAWVTEAAGHATWMDGAWLTRLPRRMAPASNAPVLVLLGSDSEEARAELLAHAGAGARVYALVGPGWGKDQADNQLLQAPRVLVRRLSEVPASAVQVGSEARLWIGGGFVLRLDPTQTEAFRQTFLRLFWHEATEEAWSGGRQFVWRPARERPFDVPEVPTSAPVRWEPPDARLTGDLRGALLHLSAGLPPDTAPRRLWFPAGPGHHERLAQLAQVGVEVQWTDRGLPDFLVNGGAGEVLLPGTRGRLRLRLSANQAPEVVRLLEAPPAWRFQANVRLGEPNHRTAKFWLPGEGTARGLEAEQAVEVPEVQAASLREVPTTAPASVPTAQPLALAVRYQWTVVPPRVPIGAEEDALVGRWRKLDEDWSSRLARVKTALVAADGDRGRIGHAFSRLVSAMLGFERTHDRLLAQVGILEKQRPSASGPAGAPALLAQLGELEDASRKLQADLDEAERKAREDEEREKQQVAWQSRVNAANRDLLDQRADLTTAESRSTTITEQLRDIEESLKSADKEVGKDLTASQRKLSDDLLRANKEVTRLRGQITALEQQAAERFEFRPPPAPTGRSTQPGGRFVPSTSSARPVASVPDEALPEVGALRSHKGQRYLVIQTWDQVAAGEQTAARLNAKLVAPENT
ncbi:MAG: hypothetical protein MUF64_19470 [Polyangiaceae bacterium]|jgi:hypothetical protein|nr:hypothetical protein [Polyangiaceae bacterium]